jgi:phosphocarrier protein
MIERNLQVTNRLGLHARASAKLAKLAGGYGSRIVLGLRGREVNVKSIMGLMMLAATCGSTVHLRVDGADEVEAAEAIAALFERKFDEGD